MIWSRMVPYGAQVYNQETEQNAQQSVYIYHSHAPYGTVHDHFIAVGQTRPVHISSHARLLADRIRDQIYISHNLPTISIKKQRCEVLTQALPTDVNRSDTQREVFGMQRGCVGWAQRRQTACDDHMDECYSRYGTFPETCTLRSVVHHRPNLKMSMGQGRSHGQRPGNLGCTSGCGRGVPIRQTSVGSALQMRATNGKRFSPGGKTFPEKEIWE